jgi:hypothetical protein
LVLKVEDVGWYKAEVTGRTTAEGSAECQFLGPLDSMEEAVARGTLFRRHSPENMSYNVFETKMRDWVSKFSYNVLNNGGINCQRFCTIGLNFLGASFDDEFSGGAVRVARVTQTASRIGHALYIAEQEEQMFSKSPITTVAALGILGYQYSSQRQGAAS